MTDTRERITRVLVALAIGVAATFMTRARSGDALPIDSVFWFGAADLLLRGLNPYEEIGPGRVVDINGAWAYPLPAAVVTMPFLAFGTWGASLLVGCGFALAAYGLTGMQEPDEPRRIGWWRLLILASAPAGVTHLNGQWSPAMLGAALIPAFGWLLAIKPTVGAALWLWRPSRTALVGGILACLLTVPLLVTWPIDFLRVATGNHVVGQYLPPLLRPGGMGIVLAFVVLRWRRREARLLGFMSLVPQNGYLYDQLPLLLIPRTPVTIALAVFGSHVLHLVVRLTHPIPLPLPHGFDPVAASHAREPFIFFLMYLPCLAAVLMRPNVGPVRPWAERWSSRLPTWLRGAPQATTP